MALYFKTKRLTANDYKTFEELIKLFEDVFEEVNVVIPKQSYLEDLLNKKDFVVFVATLNDKVVGGLTAYELKKYYSESSEIFIYDIAIDREHQRKGVGKMLLSGLNEYCAEKGIKEIFVLHLSDCTQF